MNEETPINDSVLRSILIAILMTIELWMIILVFPLFYAFDRKYAINRRVERKSRL